MNVSTARGCLLEPKIPDLQNLSSSAVFDCSFDIFVVTHRIRKPPHLSATWGAVMPRWRGIHLTWAEICKRNTNLSLRFLRNILRCFKRVSSESSFLIRLYILWLHLRNVLSKKNRWTLKKPRRTELRTVLFKTLINSENIYGFHGAIVRIDQWNS